MWDKFDGAGRAGLLVVALCVAAASCGSLDDQEIAAQEETSTAVSTTVPPTTAAPSTVAPTTVAPTTVSPTTVAPTTVAPTTVAPTTAVPTSDVPTSDVPTSAEVEVAGTTQEPIESLPRTGPNEVMLLIAVGCALLVAGRSLVDVVNAAARKLATVGRPMPPR